MKSLLIFAMFGIVAYIGAVEIVRIFSKNENGEPLTRVDAATRVRKAVLEYFYENISENTNVCSGCLNTLPGMNAAGEIIPADVEATFSRLLDAFETSYLTQHFWHSPNVYAYIFHANNSNVSIDDSVSFWDYLNALSEADIQAWLHAIYPGCSFPHLTAVTLHGSVLTVLIAVNSAGVSEIAALRDNYRRSIAATNAPKTATDIEV